MPIVVQLPFVQLVALDENSSLGCTAVLTRLLGASIFTRMRKLVSVGEISVIPVFVAARQVAAVCEPSSLRQRKLSWSKLEEFPVLIEAAADEGRKRATSTNSNNVLIDKVIMS